MFNKLALLATVFCVATFCEARTIRGPIKVQRDFSSPILPDPEIKDFGCVVVKRADGKGGSPYAAVSGGASGSQCAQFEITSSSSGYRIRELSTNKLMSHGSGSDWIYFAKDPSDTSADTLFKRESYKYWNSPQTFVYTLRPSNDKDVIYAQYDSGDMNVKSSGFRVFVKF